jgi:hypothetical protein
MMTSSSISWPMPGRRMLFAGTPLGLEQLLRRRHRRKRHDRIHQHRRPGLDLARRPCRVAGGARERHDGADLPGAPQRTWSASRVPWEKPTNASWLSGTRPGPGRGTRRPSVRPHAPRPPCGRRSGRPCRTISCPAGRRCAGTATRQPRTRALGRVGVRSMKEDHEIDRFAAGQGSRFGAFGDGRHVQKSPLRLTPCQEVDTWSEHQQRAQKQRAQIVPRRGRRAVSLVPATRIAVLPAKFTQQVRGVIAPTLNPG